MKGNIMHHELFEEMINLVNLHPDETTEEQEARLTYLLKLHDES